MSIPVAALALDSDLDDVQRVAKWLSDHCGSLAPGSLLELELAVVEAVTNVIKHGNPPVYGQAIGLKLTHSDDAVEIVITDRGSPIPQKALANAHAALNFDPEDIENLPTSGLGLALIREATDVFEYGSADGLNTMRLVKRC